MPAPLSIRKVEDPMKLDTGQSMRASSSEPDLVSSALGAPVYPSYSTPVNERDTSETVCGSRTAASGCIQNRENKHRRGRSVEQPDWLWQTTSKLENARATPPSGGAKRSKSPVRMIFGFGKSASLNNMTETSPRAHDGVHCKTTVFNLKSWGQRMRHGFQVSVPYIQIRKRN